jgi:hypothetical protein
MAGTGLAAGALMGSNLLGTSTFEPVRVGQVRKVLRVQPALVYSLPSRKESTSWRPWGGIQTEEDVQAEENRIGLELKSLAEEADFALEILPLVRVAGPEQAANLAREQHDVLLMYAAGGWVDTLESLTNPEKWTLIFLRHRSGPVYLWYEIISNRFLRKTVDEFGQPGVTTRDIVVDRYEELLWRIRSLAGLKNCLGKRIVCVGGASGWGYGGRKAPRLTAERFGMELIDVSYDELRVRLAKAVENRQAVQWATEEASRYLSQDGILLETDRGFVNRAFLLTEVFHQLLVEHETDAITINLCMGTIMEVSGTTACLSLSLINDLGYLAFCESDFVVISSGVLLYHISGLLVFLNDPTYAHSGEVTLAHCTAPRRMNGRDYEPARLMTHFESDWGVAPKVEMSVGQNMTVVDPDFNFERWLGFRGEIRDNPFLDICRSQIDLGFTCDTDQLNDETRGFHWMACYGDYLREAEYAAGKAGLDWRTLA